MRAMMLGDRDLIVNMALDRIEGEGEWQLPSPNDFHVGDDDD